MNNQKEICKFSIGDKVLILGCEGEVIDINQDGSMLMIRSSRGLSKVSPFASSSTLRKLTQNDTNLHKRIEIKTLIPNDSGHFTSNYVCVIEIDDGRIFIDYHYTESPIKYGTGRLFSHSHISGINYLGNKYIKGGKDRLRLIALYDCKSKDEAISTFEIVLNKYKEKYGSLVFCNKIKKQNNLSIISKENQPKLLRYSDTETPIISTIEKKEDDYLETISSETFLNKNDNFFLSKLDFPVAINYEELSFLNIPNRETLLQITQDLGYKKLTISIDKSQHFPSFRKDFKKQFLINTRFKAYISQGLVLEITARTSFDEKPIDAEFFSICSDSLFWENRTGQYSKVQEHKKYRSQHFFCVFSFSHFYPNNLEEYDIYKLYTIFNSSNVIVKLGNINIFLEQEHIDYIRKNIIIYGAIEESLKFKFCQIYENKRNSWLNAKGYSSEANIRFKRRNHLTNFSIDKSAQKAIFIGHCGEEYITTLKSCTCKDFSERDSMKQDFLPCKHMFRLATELGYFKDLSNLPMDISGNAFLESLDNYAKDKSFRGFSLEIFPPWEKSFIVLRPKVTWSHLKSKATGYIELYLGFRNIYFDAPWEIDLEDSNYLKCRIVGDNYDIEDIYRDLDNTGLYRITQYPTEQIYICLATGRAFDLEIFIYGDDKPSYIFSFPKTEGFGRYFSSVYHGILTGHR